VDVSKRRRLTTLALVLMLTVAVSLAVGYYLGAWLRLVTTW